MTTQKVFEFAKEMGVETLTLMDKIRKWGLPVKSHMADLSDEMIQQIRAKLEEESPKAAAAKKKVTKKVVKKATGDSADADDAPKKVATKSTKSVTKTATKAAATKTAAAKSVAAPDVSKTVIRRKKVDAVAEEEVMAPEETPQALPEDTPEVVDTAPESTEAVHASPTEELAPEAAPAAISPAVEPDVAFATAAPAASAEEAKTAIPSNRKREIPMTQDGPVSGVRSARRNIVGKMDLNRVSQLPQARQAKPPANRNLRTGFVASAPIDIPVVGDDFDKRHGKKRGGPIAPAAGPGPIGGPKEKEKETAPPTFVSADFMKREIVFQPKKKKISEGYNRKTQITMPAAHKRVVRVFGSISVTELAQAMNLKAPVIIKSLMSNGVVANINTVLDFDTVSLIAPEFKYEALNVKKTDTELLESASFGVDESKQVHRSPVVTVMGHVDHGKTTLLDSIRKARVAAGEAGGITQHIGAYRVKTSLGEITFIDTPGHEAFTAMRARGANITDIVILVVAADDGVMPQTIEAISHAKAAGVPIIVAVNKMDKPQANPDRVKQQLSEYELLPEEWGGTTQFVPVSAIKGEGVSELLEQVSLLAEMEELTGNPERSATGVVIESRVEKGRGNVATLLVQDGTLKVGQYLVVGTIVTKVRTIHDDTGKVLKEAGPSFPVEIIGLPGSPGAGDRFNVTKDEKSAQEVAQVRKDEITKSAEAKPPTLDDLFSKIKTGDLKELPVILKTDVAGSQEAIKGLFDKIATSEVKLKMIHAAVGAISESDVLLASTTKGMIVGFNVRPDTGAQAAAKRLGVDIKTYSIVYELVDDMKKALGGLLAPEIREKVLGRAQVRETFTVPKVGMIAGCYVTDGMITRQSTLRLLRNGKVVYTGKLSSLKRFKDDAKEVQTGFECGIGIENFNDLKVGDEIEAFTQESITREL